MKSTSTSQTARQRAQLLKSERAVVRHLQDRARNHRRLSREEEDTLIEAFQEREDTGALERLTEANMWVVLNTVRSYPARHIGTLDQIQEGSIGLLQAARKFDRSRGIRFSTYAQFWVRAAVLKQLMTGYRVVRLGTTVAQRRLFFRLRKEQRALRQEGLEPTHARIAERLEVSEDEVRDMDMRMSSPAVRLDAPISSDEDGRSVGDHMAANRPGTDDLVAHKQLMERFRDTIDDMRSEFSDREVDILDLRLLSPKPWTLQSLGDRFGVSRERARQLEARLIKKLSARFKSSLGHVPRFIESSVQAPGFA